MLCLLGVSCSDGKTGPDSAVSDGGGGHAEVWAADAAQRVDGATGDVGDAGRLDGATGDVGDAGRLGDTTGPQASDSWPYDVNHASADSGTMRDVGRSDGEDSRGAQDTVASDAEREVDPATRARLTAVKDRLSTLSSEVFAFWRAHGRDTVHGGFHGTLDRAGKSTSPTEKGVIQTARHLWAMSAWYERKQSTEDVKALADDLYRFLMEHFRDAGTGEFYYQVDATGQQVTNPIEMLYANSFAIYGLSQYARVFSVAEAGQQALTTFRAIDARTHDGVYGGYDQRGDTLWMGPGAAKETNTHIHLMESFGALYEYSRDETVRARLEELVGVVIEKLLQPSGYLHKEFTVDWVPVGDPMVSYGHDIETAWLLLDAARILGRPNDPEIVSAARVLGLHAVEAGYDSTVGGFFEEGPLGGAATARNKIWWVQAEALPGLFKVFELTGTPALLERLEGTLGFIETYLRDPRYGEWHASTSEDGTSVGQPDNKGYEWKASYHNLRALLFTERWIEARR